MNARRAGARPHRRRRGAFAILASAAASAFACASATTAQAQTSLSGSSISFKSNSSTTLSSQGYLGTYLVVPAGGATVNFTVNATAAAGATPAPQMNLVIADSVSGFTVSNTAASNYTTPSIALPAGTYFVRNERDVRRQCRRRPGVHGEQPRRQHGLRPAGDIRERRQHGRQRRCQRRARATRPTPTSRIFVKGRQRWRCAGRPASRCSPAPRCRRTSAATPSTSATPSPGTRRRK